MDHPNLTDSNFCPKGLMNVLIRDNVINCLCLALGTIITKNNIIIKDIITTCITWVKSFRIVPEFRILMLASIENTRLGRLF